VNELSPAMAELLRSVELPRLPGEEGSVSPRCKYFGRCGGCQLQHLSYAEQTEWKTRRVADFFEKAGFDPALVHPTNGSEDPWGYRNKVDLTAKTYDEALHLGFLPYGEKHTLIEMDTCPIADPSINEALASIRVALPRHPELKKKLISVVCRASRSQEQVGLVYHSKLKQPNVYADLTMDIMGETEKVVGGVFVLKRKEYITGEKELSEELCGLEYRFPLRSFFQNNIPQTEELVRLVEELLQPGPEDALLDLYSGVGLFGLLLASKVKEVFLLEDTPYSVEATRQNAARLRIENVTILQGQAQERIEIMRRVGQLPTAVILDPPRSGCHQTVIDTIASMPGKPRVVYVSCNPETHARDCARFVERGYKLEGVWPVDLFPQTLHVEGVAKLV
jgi:23S rRNA (uracil1939-C5)-methyltransferase